MTKQQLEEWIEINTKTYPYKNKEVNRSIIICKKTKSTPIGDLNDNNFCNNGLLDIFAWNKTSDGWLLKWNTAYEIEYLTEDKLKNIFR
jgi:hypothetical protein